MKPFFVLPTCMGGAGKVNIPENRAYCWSQGNAWTGVRIGIGNPRGPHTRIWIIQERALVSNMFGVARIN
jgi:hypothetical protein